MYRIAIPKLLRQLEGAMVRKKNKEKQYAVEVKAVFVVHAESLKDAKQEVEDRLNGMNTISVQILDGQALLPQIEIEE